MSAKTSEKILLFDDIARRVSKLRQAGKVVVQTHGIFDVIHPGIISHLNSARSQGDVLIATVIRDKDVRRGPGRPIFPEKLRAENVASLRVVDYVCIVDDETPFECVKIIKPDIFAKGQTLKDRVRSIHDKIFEEEREIFFGKCRIYETEGFSLFSSSQIINNFLDIYPEETRSFLRGFSRKYSPRLIEEKLAGLKDMKVLLIGDGIIDEYHYCSSMNKSAKAHLVVNKYLSHEVFAGGSFAIANHMAGLCSEVRLVSLLGAEDAKEDFIRNSLKPNVIPKFFYREDSPTIVKSRFINQYLNQKLFEINYINDAYIGGALEKAIIKFLRSEIPKYDLVIISDFGHGFITEKIIRFAEGVSTKLAVNTQINGANAGFNMVTKYKKPFFVCLDEPEVRLATQERFTEIGEVARSLAKEINAKYLIVTLGKKGSVGVGGRLEVRTPVLSSRVIDTVGAGDAFFAFTAPCLARGMNLDMVSFIGNAVGALAVQIMGNKKSVEKHELLEFVYSLLKQV